MKFQKQTLKDIVREDTDAYKIIEDKVVDNTRWSIVHDVVFQDLATGKFYATGYSKGATEMQDERPFEYDPDEIECPEVKPVEKTVIEYVEI